MKKPPTLGTSLIGIAITFVPGCAVNEEAKLRKACALHDAGAITNEEFLNRIRINEMTNEYSTEKFCAFYGSRLGGSRNSAFKTEQGTQDK